MRARLRSSSRGDALMTFRKSIQAKPVILGPYWRAEQRRARAKRLCRRWLSSSVEHLSSLQWASQSPTGTLCGRAFLRTTPIAHGRRGPMQHRSSEVNQGIALASMQMTMASPVRPTLESEPLANQSGPRQVRSTPSTPCGQETGCPEEASYESGPRLAAVMTILLTLTYALRSWAQTSDSQTQR